MKRTRIVRRKTRHCDTPESRQRRDDYRLANQTCEVTAFLRFAWKVATTAQRERIAEWRESTGYRDDHEFCHLDHIWGTVGGRLDLWGMLIVVRVGWHEWKTANHTAGVLLFLIVKANKPTPEINAVEFRQCSGMDLAGWLDLDKTREACPAWLDPLRRLLIASLETAK